MSRSGEAGDAVKPYGYGRSKKTQYAKFAPSPNGAPQRNGQPVPPQDVTPAEREEKRLKLDLKITPDNEPRRDRNW